MQLTNADSVGELLAAFEEGYPAVIRKFASVLESMRKSQFAHLN